MQTRSGYRQRPSALSSIAGVLRSRAKGSTFLGAPGFRIPTLVVSMLLLTASVSWIYAGTLAGVTLPDTVQLGNESLVLNGLGLRTEFMVKVYVAGLYLSQKTSDANGIIKSDAPKEIVLHFLHDATKKQLNDAFAESIKENSPEAGQTVKPDLDRLFSVIEPLKAGDQMVFTYLPAKGTVFTINGKEKLAVPGPVFAQVLFSMWFGPKPPTAGLKKGLLGQ